MKVERESQKTKTWAKPSIEWEEPYEPVVFAGASCTSQAFNCGAGAR